MTISTNKRRLTVIFSIAMLTFGATVSAHHSFDADFNSAETVTVEGVVTEFWFANPHARIYLDIHNADGVTEEWMTEGGSRNVLLRRGWSQETVTKGMTLIVTGNPSRNGSKSIGWNSITTTDGVEVGP